MGKVPINTCSECGSDLDDLTISFGQFQTSVAALWASSDLSEQPSQGLAVAAKLAEETGEVAGAILRLEGHKPATAEGANKLVNQLQDEIGDVLFVLARICNQYEIDLATAGGDALERFNARYVGKPE